MTREQQIIETAKEYYNPKSKTPSSLQMRVGFITGAQWADRTILEEVLKWLKEKTYTIYNRGGSEAFNINFESEEQMLQSFKERFNIE